jgi:hypothetical protein
MVRLRRHLLALVMAFPLWGIALATWSVADDPVVQLQDWGVHGGRPVWQVADVVIRVCALAVAVVLMLGAVATAYWRARRLTALTASGNVVAAAVVVVGPALLYVRHVRDPGASIPQSYLLALLVSLLAGIAILVNAAAGADSDGHTARLAAVPAVLLVFVGLTLFGALAVYATDLFIHGVPLIGPIGVARVYPIDALPSGYAGLPATLGGSLAASLAAFVGTVYALAGIARGARVTSAPTADAVIELGVASL